MTSWGRSILAVFIGREKGIFLYGAHRRERERERKIYIGALRLRNTLAVAQSIHPNRPMHASLLVEGVTTPSPNGRPRRRFLYRPNFAIRSGPIKTPQPIGLYHYIYTFFLYYLYPFTLTLYHCCYIYTHTHTFTLYGFTPFSLL